MADFQKLPRWLRWTLGAYIVLIVTAVAIWAADVTEVNLKTNAGNYDNTVEVDSNASKAILTHCLAYAEGSANSVASISMS